MQKRLEEIENRINEIKNTILKSDSKYDKFFNFIGMSGMTVLLSAFFLSLLGFVDLRIVNNIQLDVLVDNLLKYSLYSLNILSVFAIVYRNISFKIFLITFFYIVIYLFFENFNFYFIDILLIFILLIFLKPKKITKIEVIKRYVIFIIISTLFQLIFSFIKFNLSFYEVVNVNSIVAIIFSIDLIIFYIYYFLIVKRKEGANFETIYITTGLDQVEFPTIPENKSVRENSNPVKEILGYNDLTLRQKVVFVTLVQGYQLIQMLIVLGIGVLNNMFIELIVMLITFWIGRAILKKSWHSDKLWLCSTMSFLCFYILTKITPPFELSLFMVVLCSGVFVYTMHFFGVKSEHLELFYKEQVDKNKLSEDNIKRILIETKTPIKYHDYLIQTIVFKVKDVDFFESCVDLIIDEQQYRNYKTKFKKKLRNLGIEL